MDSTGFVACSDKYGTHFKDLDQYYKLEDLTNVTHNNTSGHLRFNGQAWTTEDPPKQNEILFHGNSGTFSSSPNLTLDNCVITVNGSLECRDGFIRNNVFHANELRFQFKPVHQITITDPVQLDEYQGLILTGPDNVYYQNNLYSFTVHSDKVYEGKSNVFIQCTKPFVKYVSDIVNGSFTVNLYNLLPTFGGRVRIYFRVT